MCERMQCCHFVSSQSRRTCIDDMYVCVCLSSSLLQFQFLEDVTSDFRTVSGKRSKLLSSCLFSCRERARLSAQILQFLCLYHHICKTCFVLLSHSHTSSYAYRDLTLSRRYCARPRFSLADTVRLCSTLELYIFFSFSLS